MKTGKIFTIGFSCALVCAELLIPGCIDDHPLPTDLPDDPDDPLQQNVVVMGACSVATGLPPGGDPTWIISPGSTIVSDHTRSVFPRLARPGGWSTTAQFIADSHGLTLPAIVATSNSIAGWISLPFETNESIAGVSLTICNDATTTLIADTFATQFSSQQRTNNTDSLVGTGSIGAGGSAGVWHVVDIGPMQLFLGQNSTLWMDISALQTPASNPPSMAISAVTLHLNTL